MFRPSVRNLENYPAVSAYYAQHKPDPRYAGLCIRLAGLGIHPHFSFNPGVEEAVEEAAAGKFSRVIMPAHHPSYHDPGAITQVTRHSPALRGLETTTFVGAMHTIFVGNPLKRRAADNRGAVAFPRGKDFKNPDRKTKDLLLAAAKIFVDTSVTKINDHEMNMVSFVNGETVDDQRIVEPFERKSVLGQIVKRVDRHLSLLFIPIGVYYTDYVDGSGKKGEAHPYIHFGAPPEEQITPDTPKLQIGKLLHPCLQAATNRTYEHAMEKTGPVRTGL